MFLLIFIIMKRKNIITIKDQLKINRRVSRETTHIVKPMITIDKKKDKNKKMCRKKIW